MEDDLLALETRRRIYGVVVQAPGLGSREIQRQTGMAWGETTYHLDRLVTAGLVHREQGGHQDHYFAATVPLGDRTLLRLARSDASRRLLGALLTVPDQTVPELQEHTGLSPGRLSIHLRRFLETGLVESGRRERFRTFRIADRERVVRLLVAYRSGFADGWADRLLETWSEVFRP
ncbi:MAG TPA: winged helix-turn-helix transcriptional regulator [Thermoplasmata archaeon]|nr:winged helix-turn-helix transcriptional regulator [Thermoplasmata archaeon]